MSNDESRGASTPGSGPVPGGSQVPGTAPDPVWQPPQPTPTGQQLHPAPQPVLVAPQPSTFKRAFGWGFGGGLGVGTVLLALMVAGSLLSMALLGAMGAMFKDLGTPSADGTSYETVWGQDDAEHTLRAIDVRGPIMAGGDQGLGLTQATYGYEVADAIDKIGKDDVDGLVLRMDTPGGTINGARAIGDAVTRYQQRTGHKVVAVVEGMSASGGMFAMAPANKIIADHGTLTGSIGVISGPFQQYKDVKAIDGGLLGGGVTTTGGITSEYISQGKGKDFGNPWRAMTAEERAVWTQGIATEYTGFVDWVAKYRKIPAATIRNDLGAHIFDPETAKKKGLVDAVMGRDEAYREAARTSGLDPAKTRIEAAAAPSFMDSLLSSQARTYGQAPAAVAREGQPPRVTSVICAGTPQVLAWSGPTAQFCGR